jgi:DNA polymerase/3'-5' exonuclease PolX
MATQCVHNEDKKEVVLELLTQLKNQETNQWKSKAYSNAIAEMKNIDVIFSLDDLQNVKGFGKGILKKIDELLTTGTSKYIKIDNRSDQIETLMKIHGIGPKKARDLVHNYDIDTVDKLETRLDLLNDVQKKGLKYYKDTLVRIPFKEMQKHDEFISSTAKTHGLTAVLAGSYRRLQKDSGDIDVIIKGDISKFSEFCEDLVSSGYLLDILAKGSKKVLAVCKLKRHKHIRRIDLMFISEDKFPFAILYFTGSSKFNIEMRNKALQMGYTMNEYGIKAISGEEVEFPFEKEEDIFEFLEMDYVLPKDRR